MSSGPEVPSSWALPDPPVPGEDEELLTGEDGVGLRWFRPAPVEVYERARRFREARDRVLLARSTEHLVRTVGRVGLRFLDSGDPLRVRAVEGLPHWAGVSPAMARAIVDGMAADWTPDRLERLVAREFPEPGVLERFTPVVGGGRARALGNPLLVQVLSGSVPGVSATAMIRGLLVRSATLVKPGRGDLLLSLLWVQGLTEEDPEMAGVVGVHYWPGGNPEAREVEAAWLESADRIVVYGGVEAVEAARAGAREGVPVVPYPHRISVGLIGREVVLDGETVRSAARAVSLFDGRGCVTPQLLFVEEGGGRSVELWAEALGSALGVVADDLPPGRLTPGEAATIQRLRGVAEVKAAAGGGGRVIRGEGTRWTVLVDPGNPLRGVCPGRVVRVVPVEELGGVPRRLQELAPHLQTAALAVDPNRLPALAESLARAGLPRITTLDAAPWPPAWWYHDGEGPLRALVRWADLEGC